MNKYFSLIGFLFIAVASFAGVTLPKLFTSNMVLQREKPVKIWGWAGKGEKVTVQFNSQKVTVKADKAGAWLVVLQPMQAGGPYDLSINNTVLSNVLIGDVFICSGQSNMEWVLKNTNNAAKEIAASIYPNIRLFTVKKALRFAEKNDVEAEPWAACGPATSGDFSAVAYFFARKLVKDMAVPIGLIHTSWGGTNIEAWTSWDIMSSTADYSKMDLAKMEADREGSAKRQEQFQASLKNDKGDAEKWYEPATAVTGWKNIQLPQAWEQTEIGNADGIVWFKKEFNLTGVPSGKKITLNLGPIDDEDITWINGKQVGSLKEWNTDRVYEIDPAVLVAGKNTIIIKVTDNAGGGGLYGKPEQLYLQSGAEKISLAGEWQYKASVLNTSFNINNMGPNSFPSQLYNAMIAPLTQFAIKGAIWYQGESNAGEAFKYRTLFPGMINNWRNKWGDSFPFLWVQLANFMKTDSLPVQSNWAELREAQSMTMQLSQTGQAVIIDIGEAGDIHPRNKQDVGYRLALAAEKVVYNKDVVYSGPVYQSVKAEGNKMIVQFTNTGSGLLAKDKYGYLKGFAIAGSDQHFVWAQATIEGDKVIVQSNAVPNPVAVRYAWANNPDDAGLYNKEGLPASPFRTDSWKGITEK
ncbi:MAG: sialate O-acetylesterase [Chitinophagaceae bacterium]